MALATSAMSGPLLPGLAAPVAALGLLEPGGVADASRVLAGPSTRHRVAHARSFEELSRALRDAPIAGGEH